MERFKYAELLTKLQGFDEWLNRLGIEPRSDDRIHAAIGFLRRAERETQRWKETGQGTPLAGQDLFPIVEALEAFEVFSAFGDRSSADMAKTMRRALSGPSQPIEETDLSRDGRNIWFELALGAEWSLRGESVLLGEPDLQLNREGSRFLVACKRPAKELSIHANIRGALKQLNRNLESAPESCYGVAAISMSKVLNAGDKYWEGSLESLGNLLEVEMGKFTRSWRAANTDPRIAAILFHVATPTTGANVDLARATFTIVDAVNDSPGTEILKRFARDMKRHTSE